MTELSIIIPVYNEEESLRELSQWINRALAQEHYSYEVIFVDDGSTDASWERIKELAAEDPRIRGIRFNRNYGKSAALQTGFRASAGRVVVTLDADLQDSPDEIPELYRMIVHEGYQLVSGWKKKRKDPITKTLPSRFFNFVTRKISGIPIHDFNCGLKAYRSEVVKSISVYGEMHRYIPVMARWAGFNKITEKVVQHHERKYGYSKFGFERFVRGFLDLLTIMFVGRFALRPMHFFGTLGMLSFLAGFLFTAKLFWDKIDAIYFSGTPLRRDITQQPLFYLALVAVIIGVQLFVTGFLAELIARQSLSRKDYLIAERAGFAEKEKAGI
ncbi:MAG: glycosyl transferase [Cyclobacteriaceae bacterium]|nr:MAG: glycosyl transferase [Cyclobacteriaceae bacterium]